MGCFNAQNPNGNTLRYGHNLQMGWNGIACCFTCRRLDISVTEYMAIYNSK